MWGLVLAWTGPYGRTRIERNSGVAQECGSWRYRDQADDMAHPPARQEEEPGTAETLWVVSIHAYGCLVPKDSWRSSEPEMLGMYAVVR